ncbi:MULTISPECIES: PaaI family thioesterase [Rhodococcus]|uniref:Acyl-coenzyme A thioesterase THEM4 n=1 Tax=Rhodococcus oxybenzonivorans TaxID=1990687 RepID=A0AAE5A9G7_9NOCA|nr:MULTISPECIES: PaaI family thioesterase [Rhodococcus]MDV7243254.1 PaaI family thioesterase [Rhodococcus oxybenzonivorans]MDV7268193.1 PaaI family thioesterase [Rhodococcus oxybenzonivorans]MDV7276682.1 PaaI family thioesterase [Rhodococcus oxybenzonivorans]MDV7334487.1 PaaI family thioesterase [Rhodococcus oxybenzonivorans]MDV7344641.1 PaaI family thioesterase [Rhodococcus oxybenzonivorans]
MNTSTHPTFENSTAGTVLTSPSDGAAVDRATEAARRVIDALLRTDRANANLERVAEELNSIAEHLEEHAPAVAERLIDMWNGEGVTRHDPVTGPENALAPPVVLEGLADGSVQGTVTLTIPYQGPPGHVHGGVSALLLDHVLGVANAWGGKSGMTAQLSTRYHRPTPLFEPLTLTGKLIGVDGRKISTVGDIRTADGQVCVSVEGLFIDKTVPRPR